ncbi:MAG: ATP-binding protein [Candidatus Omnitrophica bacterium]|nr:ATP-binding protein [Candidatus Omnitrophota bacterium]MDD5671252.1 ATP-binding protein [Candidatus Omnitrophota bacterium]
MNPYSFSVFFFATSTLFIGLLIWYKQRDAVNRSYLLFSCFVALWGATYAVVISDGVPAPWALFWARFTNGSALFIPVTWFHFTLAYTGNVKTHERTLKYLYALAFVVSCFAFSPWLVTAVRPVWLYEHYPKPGPFYNVLTFLYFVLVPVGFIPLFLQIGKTAGQARKRVVWLMIATLAGFSGGALTFVPIYGIPLPQYGVFLMPVYPFVMAYLVGRKSLFDEYQLIQAMQRDKLAAIGTLAASINHEIRSPLFVIQGYTDSFMGHVQDGQFGNEAEFRDQALKMMCKINLQATRAMDIMKRFAVFAKTEAHPESPSRALRIHEVLENILPLVGHEMELDKIELINSIQPDLPAIAANVRQVEEILFNLIVNACQAMKSGGRIEINAAFDAEKIRISVKDNGPGIPGDKVAQIFEPFYTTKEEGTGLGLYVTKQLVERNGGRITVESRVGKGTSFVLEFGRASE